MKGYLNAKRNSVSCANPLFDNTLSRRARIKWLVSSILSVVLLFAMYTVQAHNLQTRMVYMYLDPDTQALLDERIAGNDPCFPNFAPPAPLLRGEGLCEDGVTEYPGDELGFIIKVVPQDGTKTGVGGHIDFENRAPWRTHSLLAGVPDEIHLFPN